MACFKYLFSFPVIFVLLAQPFAQAQTPDSKSKATASISGRVTVGDKPAPGIIVTANPFRQGTLLVQTVSDAEGKYRLNGLPAGQVSVAAWAPTFVQPESSDLDKGRILDLAADETVEGIDLKLTKGGVITSRITDVEAKPVIDERVEIVRVNDKGESDNLRQPIQANWFMNGTDDRGIYRVYGLPAGRYKVSI